MKRLLLLYGSAAAVLAAGVLSVGVTVRAWPEHQRHLEQKTRALRELDRLAATREALTSRQTLEKLPQRQPRRLVDLVRDMSISLQPTLQQRDQLDVGHGWTLRTFSLRFEQIDLPQLGRILEHVGAARPPWRLREATVRATENQPGQAWVELTLEALSKP